MSEVLIEKAEDIYYSALEIASAEQRMSFVDDACRGNDELRSVVKKLLASQDKAEKFFPEGGVARLPVKELSKALTQTPGLVENVELLAAEGESIGKYIGSYKLLQRIGEGGCGVVYMAEQEKPVRRRVALKIIKLGMDTRGVIARFEAERQALALMDHPNIARVLDAGATETGRPYFVMELVRGVKITEYCDQNQLDTRQRLRLFIQVCQAIQHAHQKGVIHRDIKPSNILVTIIDGQPVPKVIDFGIAKAIEGRLTDNTIFTAYEQFIGTPAYMSPEQAVMSGVDVDTRSDIYSLGVLLYELLTGRTPFETKDLLERGFDSLRRTLQEKEPQRPSVIVTTLRGLALTQLAHRHQAEPLKLISLLRGDLDWIVIRALEKERARRYQTANGLAMDVQRFLDDEPVVARPPSRWYRLQKLVHRNKAAFAAATLAVAALIAGLGTSIWFWHQERESRQLAVAAEQQALIAEQQQSQLRAQAENRERITQAAFLISQGKMEEADSVVSKVTAIEPSLEAESVLRALGEWHAVKGRWAQAEERFNLLLKADQQDNSWAITDDLLMAGPILIERDDLQGYERFRRAAIARRAGTTDPIFAERTLKICLLTPADEQVMKTLQPFEDVSSNSLQGRDLKDFWDAWRCISLALMAYRQDYNPTAKTWCDRCLSFNDGNIGRYATAHIIRAMACYKLDEITEAKSELLTGRNLVSDQFTKGLDQSNASIGFWYDWLFARILLREADSLIENTLPHENSVEMTPLPSPQSPVKK
ncbi:MAG TPA: serine/threonine-protein kinase [Verrucomicrobiae bacterium]|nr:serine/threonine-protein kinase [Verrucomicrobiae bacterium]